MTLILYIKNYLKLLRTEFSDGWGATIPVTKLFIVNCENNNNSNNNNNKHNHDSNSSNNNSNSTRTSFIARICDYSCWHGSGVY